MLGVKHNKRQRCASKQLTLHNSKNKPYIFPSIFSNITGMLSMRLPIRIILGGLDSSVIIEGFSCLCHYFHDKIFVDKRNYMYL